MTRTGLVLRNAGRSRFRSWMVALCAAMVASLLLTAFVISHGSRASLKTALDRVGADVLVVPAESAQQVETALLMGVPTHTFMPEDVLSRVKAVAGVSQVSPQLYLSTLKKASCCTVGELFLVAYDPASDFTLRPWLEQEVPGGLGPGEAIGGTFVAAPEGQKVLVYGSPLTLKANLSPTGTGIDQTLFFTFDTAKAVARDSTRLAQAPLDIPTGTISAVLVRIAPGAMVANVAFSIEQVVRGVKAIPSPRLFQSYRQQMDLVSGALRTFSVVTIVGAGLVIGLVFALAGNERRREMGVLRAIGATRAFVFGALVAEGALLSLIGALLGAVLSGLLVFVFHELFVVILGVPFVLPTPALLLGQGVATVGLAVAIASLSAAFSALRISQEEPAQAMRERA